MIVRFLKFFLLSLSLYLVIPLAGWVLGGETPIFSAFDADLASFFQDPARLAFAVLAAAAAAARGLILALNPLPPHSDVTLSELTRWRNIALESILVLAPFSDQRGLLGWGDMPALRWLGLLLFAAGMGLVLAATRVYLRHEKSLLPPPAPRLLLISGPYHRVRHPIQLGMLVFALGLALNLLVFLGLLCLDLAATAARMIASLPWTVAKLTPRLLTCSTASLTVSGISKNFKSSMTLWPRSTIQSTVSNQLAIKSCSPTL